MRLNLKNAIDDKTFLHSFEKEKYSKYAAARGDHWNENRKFLCALCREIYFFVILWNLFSYLLD